jgi:RNA polymerase sigma-70 factor (ECF subfamily)
MAAGDMNAFDELYSMLSVRIFNYARAITNHKETAEDVTHDVFLQVYKHAARIAGVSDPVAYIMAATRNQSFDSLKRGRRAAMPLEDVSGICVASPSHDRLLIEDAFSFLPENQRETLYLHHVCGYTQKEVSKIMNVPLATVKWRCRKASSQLKAYFNQDKEEKCNVHT